jgi:hypothetical protein
MFSFDVNYKPYLTLTPNPSPENKKQERFRERGATISSPLLMTYLFLVIRRGGRG